jgi:hypothetical protein
MVSPGLSASTGFNEAGAAAVVVTQTSPVDLPTDQIPSSPASAPELASNETAMVKARHNSLVLSMESSAVPTVPVSRLTGNVSTSS